jgi:hypothetical protein
MRMGVSLWREVAKSTGSASFVPAEVNEFLTCLWVGKSSLPRSRAGCAMASPPPTCVCDGLRPMGWVGGDLPTIGRLMHAADRDPPMLSRSRSRSGAIINIHRVISHTRGSGGMRETSRSGFTKTRTRRSPLAECSGSPSVDHDPLMRSRNGSALT